MASAIGSLMHQLGIFDQEYGLMGHSLGGAVALLVARLAPRAPNFFVSIEGNTTQDDCGERGLAREVARQAPTSVRMLERVRHFDSPTGVWASNAARLGDSLGPFGHRLFASLVKWCDSGELLDTFLSIGKVRYLCGERSGKYHVGTWASLQRHPDARCIEIKGAGHFMLDEKPQESIDALRSLLGAGTLPARASAAVGLRAPRADAEILRADDIPAATFCSLGVEGTAPTGAEGSVQLVIGSGSGGVRHATNDQHGMSRHDFGYSLLLSEAPSTADPQAGTTFEVIVAYSGMLKLCSGSGHSALLDHGDLAVVPPGTRRSLQRGGEDFAKMLCLLPGRPLRAGKAQEFEGAGKDAGQAGITARDTNSRQPALLRPASFELGVQELECSEQSFLSMVHRVADRPCIVVPRGDGEVVIEYVELAPEVPALHFEAQAEDWLVLLLEGENLLVNGSALRAGELCLLPRGSDKELRLPENHQRALALLARSTLKRATLGTSGSESEVLPRDPHREAKRRRLAAEVSSPPAAGGAGGQGFLARLAARPQLGADTLLRLQRCATASVFDGWEQVTSRDSGQGFFSQEPFLDHMPQMGPMVGYAVTVQISPGSPDNAQERGAGRLGFHAHLASLPASLPKVVVVQDMDKPRLLGSLWGASDVAVARALGCVGCLTDGAVRDVDQAAAAGFHLVSRGTSVGSTRTAMPLRWDLPVEVFGVTVRPGQLLHADRHGFLAVQEEDEPRLLEAVDFMAALQQRHALRACAEGFGSRPAAALAADLECAARELEEERRAKFAAAAER